MSIENSLHSKAGIMIAETCDSGLKTEVLIHKYNEWSEHYEDIAEHCFKGPEMTAKAVVEYFEDTRDVSILDVAAGTGLVGAKLKQLGFHQIDALDASDGMLNIAKGKDRYQKYFNILFRSPVDVIPESSYDVLVCCGSMVEGHLMCDSLSEMVRCVRTGGLVVIVMREEFLYSVAEYNGRLEPYMKQLETEGLWVQLERSVFPEYLYQHNGLKFVFRVTKAGGETAKQGV